MAHTFKGDNARQARRMARELREARRTRRGDRPNYGRTDFRGRPILKALQASR